MKFELPPLPYDKTALEPYISARTLEFHYEKHHKGYLNKLKAAIGEKPEAEKSLEEIIRGAKGGVFNNAAQVWNHTFYWNSLAPKGGGKPAGDLAAAIERAFGNFADFKQKLAEIAGGQFGSGWAWVVAGKDGKVQVTSTPNAENPLTTTDTPLLTIDVWEHAYYLDFQNDRPKYLSSVLDHLLNWSFAEQNYKAAKK
jgi:Fe-Mn family superoxide dismutase